MSLRLFAILPVLLAALSPAFAADSFRSEERLEPAARGEMAGRMLGLIDQSLHETDSISKEEIPYAQAMVLLRTEEFLRQEPGEYELQALPQEHRIVFLAKAGPDAGKEAYSISYLPHSPQMSARSLAEAYAVQDLQAGLRGEDRDAKVSEILAAFDGTRRWTKMAVDQAASLPIAEVPPEAPQGLPSLQLQAAPTPHREELGDNSELREMEKAKAEIGSHLKGNFDQYKHDRLLRALGNFQVRFSHHAELLRDVLNTEVRKAKLHASKEFHAAVDPHYSGTDAAERMARAVKHLEYWKRLERNARSRVSLFWGVLPDGRIVPAMNTLAGEEFTAKHFAAAAAHLENLTEQRVHWALADIRQVFVRRIALFVGAASLGMLAALFLWIVHAFTGDFRQYVIIGISASLVIWTFCLTFAPLTNIYKTAVVETATGFGWAPPAKKANKTAAPDAPAQENISTPFSRRRLIGPIAGLAVTWALYSWPILIPWMILASSYAIFHFQHGRLRSMLLTVPEWKPSFLSAPSEAAPDQTAHREPASARSAFVPQHINVAFAWRHCREIMSFIKGLPEETKDQFDSKLGFHVLAILFVPLVEAIAMGWSPSVFPILASPGVWRSVFFASGSLLVLGSVIVTIGLFLKHCARLAIRFGWAPKPPNR